jgi:signal transduction histidine kinase
VHLLGSLERRIRLSIEVHVRTVAAGEKKMHPFDELKAYVGFSVADEERLRALLPHVMPEAVRISDRFYETILLFPDATAVFEDLAQVNRLKKTLVKWIEQLLTGPFDLDYYALRRRIGSVHVKVGLPQQYMFTAMNKLMQDVHDIASAAFPAQAPLYAASLRRITDIELAIMLGTYIDVREKGQLETLRDLLVSHLRTTVLLVDKERRIATCACASAELFTAVEVTGKLLSEALDPELFVQARLEEHVARAVSTEREIIVPRVDVSVRGRVRMLRLAIVPLRHPTADALIQIEDLTETLAAEERAKTAEHLAKLGTMAASVAHEIRNPLAGISGTVQFVAGSLPPDDGRVDALREVQSQIARLGTLVGDLLNFSRPITVQCAPVELAVVAHNAVAQATASEGHAADIEGDGVANADGALLGQVLLNLVQNAWQAGAKRVLVKVSDGHVFVCDDGPGIPADNRARVFEPFFTTKVRGTGLGLPVAKKVVEAMGGTLSIAESPLGGAAFDVALQGVS